MSDGDVNEVTPELIERRAREISRRGEAGTDEEIRRRAERELREGRRPEPEGPWAKTSSGRRTP
jgi:hypothetical protein